MTEQKKAHEWTYESERYRVAHGVVRNFLTDEIEFDGWLLSVESPGGSWYPQTYVECKAAAAEIARLAGLTEENR